MKKIGKWFSRIVPVIALVHFGNIPLSGTAAGYNENRLSFSNTDRCEKYISAEELRALVQKNETVYRYFYRFDSRDEWISDHIYTVNMPDFKGFGEFYSFVASVYTSDIVKELFHDFQGHGRSFFEEDGLFLADQALTFTATVPLYSPLDSVQILSGSEQEIVFIYWFAYPQRVWSGESFSSESVGIKMSVLKEEGEWRLSGMIRLNWGSDRTVLRDQQLKTCSAFSPLIKTGLYVMNLQWKICEESLSTGSTDFFLRENSSDELEMHLRSEQDVGLYASTPLGEITSLDITAECGCDLSFLSEAKALASLSFSNGEARAGQEPMESYVQSFEFLSSLTRLSELHIYGVKDFPLSCLSGLPELNEITLSACSVGELPPASSSVKKLALYGCDFPSELLRRFPDLTDLEIDGRVDDFSFLKETGHLRVLSLTMTGFSNIENLASCNGLTDLTVLSRKGADAAPLENVEFLKELSGLKKLSVYNGALSAGQKETVTSLLPNCEIVEYEIP